MLSNLRRYVVQFSTLGFLFVSVIFLDFLPDFLDEDGAAHQLVDRSLRLAIEVADLDEVELTAFR